MQNIVEKINSLMHSIGREVKLPIFGKTCTPEHPVGACMVSAEGSCAAYYKYSAVFHR